MRTCLFILIAVILIITGISRPADTAPAQASPMQSPACNTPINVSNSPLVDYNARIDGDYIVWEGAELDQYGFRDNPQIYLYQISTDTKLNLSNNDSSDNNDPYIDGDYVAWSGYDSGSRKIYLYQISTGIKSSIADSGSHPHIDGDYVVWQSYDGNDTEIYLYQISTGTTTIITSNNVPDRYPYINGDYVAWQQGDEIYLYQISTATLIGNISQNPGVSNDYPRINGDYILWYTYADSIVSIEVYLYQISTGIKTKLGEAPSLIGRYRSISSEYATWHYGYETITDDYKVYLYQLSTGTQINIAQNTGVNVLPEISDDYVVWLADLENDMAGIGIYQISTGTYSSVQLSMYLYEEVLDIDGNKIVWNGYSEYIDYDQAPYNAKIFLYEIGDCNYGGPPGITLTESDGNSAVIEGSTELDSYTIDADTQPESAVSIPISVDNGQCEISWNRSEFAQSQTLIIPAYNITPQAIHVRAVDDGDIESTPHTCTILNGDPTSTDPNYDVIDDLPDVTVSITDNDSVAVEVTCADDMEETDTVTTTCDYQAGSSPTASVDIPLNVNDGQCEISLDGTTFSTALTLTLPAGSEAIQTLTVRPIDDSLQEASPHTCTIINGDPTSTDPDYEAISDLPDVDVPIMDNNTPGITVLEWTHIEGIPEADTEVGGYTLRVNSIPAAGVSIPISVTDGQCKISPSYYGNYAQSITITLSAGSFSEQHIRVRPIDDDINEADRHPCVINNGDPTSSDPNYEAIGDLPDITILIIDDEEIAIQTTCDNSMQEAGTVPVDCTYNAGSAPTAPVNVPVSVADSSQCEISTDGINFAASTTLTLPAGSKAAQTLTIRAIDDNLFEPGPHLCTLLNGDPTSSDADYDALDNIVNFNILIADDDFPDIIVIESDGNTTISEAGTTTDAYTLAAETPPTHAVSVPVSVSDGQCEVSTDGITFAASITITLPANSTAAQTITVRAVDDTATEAPTHPCTIVNGDPTSSDPSYDILTDSDVLDVTASVIDNDIPPGITLTETDGTTTVNEAGTTDTFTLAADTPPTQAVSVPVSVSGGQCEVSADGVIFAANITITLPADSITAQTVTVRAIDDAIDEDSPHTCTISTGDPASDDSSYDALTGGNIPDIAVSITDNDVAGVTLTESDGTTTLNEENETSDTYFLRLNSAPYPGETVTLTISTDTQVEVTHLNGSPVVGAPYQLTFTDANWNTPQSVTIAAVDDSAGEGPHTGDLTHTVNTTGSPQSYDSVTAPPLTVTIADNDPCTDCTPPVILDVETGCDAITVTYMAQGGGTVPELGYLFILYRAVTDEVIVRQIAPALAVGEVYTITLPLDRVYAEGMAFYVQVAGDTPVQVPAEPCTAP